MGSWKHHLFITTITAVVVLLLLFNLSCVQPAIITIIHPNVMWLAVSVVVKIKHHSHSTCDLSPLVEWVRAAMAERQNAETHMVLPALSQAGESMEIPSSNHMCWFFSSHTMKVQFFHLIYSYPVKIAKEFCKVLRQCLNTEAKCHF